jgi:hypothetical protein
VYNMLKYTCVHLWVLISYLIAQGTVMENLNFPNVCVYMCMYVYVYIYVRVITEH